MAISHASKAVIVLAIIRTVRKAAISHVSRVAIVHRAAVTVRVEAISNVRSKAAIVHSRAASVRTISQDVHNRAVTSVSTTTTTIRMQSTV